MNQHIPPPPVAPRLGLWDAVSIIVGIVVGTAIFRSSTVVFQNVAGPWAAMGVWLLGGALSWCGAVCYAELATTYPRDGGDYEYLNRAFGPCCGFLFGWAQLTTVISGNIGIMAYAFADYGLRLWPGLEEYAVWLAVSAVVALSILNALGVVAGKSTQNLLTLLKVVGLAGIVLAALWTSGATSPTKTGTYQRFRPDFGLALVFVLYAYGGWNHAAYVAAEIRDPRRNLPRALLLGIASVTLIYLAVNAAYLAALGIAAAQATPTPAADVLERACGAWGGRAISALVMLSALGAINGMILTAPRIYATWGADYPALSWLSHWNRRVTAPVTAIAVQASVAIFLIVLVGTPAGRDLCDAALRGVGLAALPWHEFLGGFEMLIAGTAPVFWAFFLLTGSAVMVQRRRDPHAERPFAVPLYPLPPLIFCAACLYMFYASLAYARSLVLLGLVPLAIGVALLLVVRRYDIPAGNP